MFDAEHLTRMFVIAGYGLSLTAAAVALVRSHLWVRKASSIALIIISAVWIGFYLWIWVRDSSLSPPPTVLVSRMLHYVTAANLFVMASLISRAERYTLVRSHDG